jgi:hypothetical protein
VRTTIDLEIVGLGIILYSPFAVRHIPTGQDYLEPHFWKPDDVARHVNACQIAAFGTGSPGRYLLELYDGPLDEKGLASATASVRLGIEVRDDSLCFRDLYDLMRWNPECPAAQAIPVANGFYRITAYTSPSLDDLEGAGQPVWLHFEASSEKPLLSWAEVPDLSGGE